MMCNIYVMYTLWTSLNLFWFLNPLLLQYGVIQNGKKYLLILFFKVSAILVFSFYFHVASHFWHVNWLSHQPDRVCAWINNTEYSFINMPFAIFNFKCAIVSKECALLALVGFSFSPLFGVRSRKPSSKGLYTSQVVSSLFTGPTAALLTLDHTSTKYDIHFFLPAERWCPLNFIQCREFYNYIHPVSDPPPSSPPRNQ